MKHKFTTFWCKLCQSYSQHKQLKSKTFISILTVSWLAFMTSLDAESLFTNIPLDETIEKLYKQPFFWWWSNSQSQQRRSQRTSQICFLWVTFDYKYYCPWDGFVIGFSLGPTLTNAYLCHFEKQIKKNNGFLIDQPQYFCPNVLKEPKLLAYIDFIYSATM